MELLASLRGTTWLSDFGVWCHLAQFSILTRRLWLSTPVLSSFGGFWLECRLHMPRRSGKAQDLDTKDEQVADQRALRTLKNVRDVNLPLQSSFQTFSREQPQQRSIRRIEQAGVVTVEACLVRV